MDRTIESYILDAIPYPIVFVDTDHIIRYLNKEARHRYYEVRGYDNLIGKSLFLCHGEKSRDAIIGAVENMSYAVCPDCGRKIYIYGESHIDEVCGKHNIRLLGQIPVDPSLAAPCDRGEIEKVAGMSCLGEAVDAVIGASENG